MKFPNVYLSIASHRRNPLTRAVARLARGFLNAYEARNLWELHNGGELGVLDALAPLQPKLVFDVGANVGDWSLAAAERLESAAIHAFEIVPNTARELARRVAANPRISVNAFGLSSATGMVSVRVPPGDASPLSTVTDRVLGNDWQEVTCRVETGAAYAKRARISRIDLLKIDTEGADYAVLQGFTPLLEQGAVKVIQFEYGPWAISTRHLLADFHELLEGNDFMVGKLYPEGVEFGPYDVRLEDFTGLNYVAARRTDADTITALTTFA